MSCGKPPQLWICRAASEYHDLAQADQLPTFLEQAALVSDVDELEEQPDAPVLLTLHLAKGLEFPVVFMVGLEEGLLPHSRSDTPETLEEERRLCYVGMTRAKERLYLVHAFKRSSFGRSQAGQASRFLKEIPSPASGISFCQGVFTEMGVDVLAEIRRFAGMGKIHLVEFRTVRGTVPRYTEVFLDEGPVNMIQAMKTYKEVGYTGPMISDHAVEVEGGAQVARSFSLGYMRAAVQAVNTL